MWSRRIDIARILTRHGLGIAVGRTGVGLLVPFHHGWLHHATRDDPYERHEHLRMLFEDLGATYIKLGQILSARPDVLPERYRSELARLQDAAPPERFFAVENHMEQSLGRPLAEVFAEFDPCPVASASIGQAHQAILLDGTEVVVKVRRPQVVEQVEIDLEILRQLARHVDRWWPPARRIGLAGLIHEFSGTLRGELDYQVEASNAVRVRGNVADIPGVMVPRVHHHASTSSVLTLDRVHGVRIDDFEALERSAISTRRLAVTVTELILKMVFEDGFFHADPHPGNLFVDRQGCIGLIDFGMVGELTPELRSSLAALLAAIVSRDIEQIVDRFVALGLTEPPADRQVLACDLEALMQKYLEQPLHTVGFGALLRDHLAVARIHHLRLPPELALLTKTLVMCEGLAARLDPEYEMLNSFAAWLPKLAVPAQTD